MNTLQEIPLKQITPSPTNPRKTFDKIKLTELAASMRACGLINPVLVRPMPGELEKEPHYELIAGERRYRACKEAGLQVIPAIVRELCEKEVIEIQVIENLQRDDLHPLEEAEGYQQLIHAHAYTPLQIGVKVGKTKSYINKTLQLLHLTRKSKAAFLDGKLLRSTALLLARIGDEKLQDKALYELLNHGEGGDMTPTIASKHIHRRYMLKLKDAPFDVRDAQLCPAAGTCSTCPKRSGNAPDLFDDVTDKSTCTDPACYGEKVEAHWGRLKSQSEAGGAVVLEGKAAQDAEYSSRYVNADEKCYEGETGGKKTWAQLVAPAVKAGTLKPVVLRGRHAGDIKTLYPAAAARVAAGIKVRKSSGREAKKAKEREALKKLRAEVAAAAVPRVIDKWLDSGPATERGIAFDRLVLDALCRDAGMDRIVFVAKRRGLCTKISEANEALENWITDKARHPDEIRGLAFELALMAEHGVSIWNQSFDDLFVEACKLAGVDLKVIEKQLVEEQKAGKGPAKKAAPAKVATAAAEFSLENLSVPMPKGFKVEIQISQLADGWAAGCDVSRPKVSGGIGVPMEVRGQDRKTALASIVAWALRILTEDMTVPDAVLKVVRTWAAKHNITKADLKAQEAGA